MKLICIAPDGEFVTEGKFESLEEVLDHEANLGSRWFFYPIHTVTGDGDTLLRRVIQAPAGLEDLEGKTLAALLKAVVERQEILASLGYFAIDESEKN